MTARTADPLPECSLCETATLRAAWEANGGLCSDCAAGLAATVRMLPVRGLVDVEALRRQREASRLGYDPDDDDRTAYVERFRPEVPAPRSRP